MIYFDNSSTTRPDESVLESFIAANMKYYANPASLHVLGREAEALLKRSKEQMLKLIDNESGEVVLTSGGTEANNLAILGIAEAYRSRGNHVITTQIEHPSILNACIKLEEIGFEVDYLAVDAQGLISIEELEKKLRKDTILVSIMHVNNEIGTIQPIRQCAELIKKSSRAVFHSDCVQSFGKLPVSMESLGLDAITVSAHKMNGLKNSGALFLKKNVTPHAINFGGGQENGLRSGTVSVPNAVAMAKAMRMSTIHEDSADYREWRNLLIDACSLYENIRILSPHHGAPHILSISFKSINGEVAVNYFQEHGIIISTSSACSSKNKNAGHVIEAIGLENKFKNGVIRVSFGNTNTKDEIAEFIKVLKSFMELIERGM
ncbi:cysteine desulfurase family protein [Sporosarcina luteola]|uniref:cysteine desulfurase family protein n=1 Tax=Sporosarcina luteola TaxID=582850 RepID=UPI00203F55B3|nr:cysteine desulfurase family protein [Sporosarcina luteola]MCM3712090.1 cysteine desulfurase [Sporosarcina luteola]